MRINKLSFIAILFSILILACGCWQDDYSIMSRNAAKIEKRYKSLEKMRKKAEKKNKDVAALLEKDWELFCQYDRMAFNSYYACEDIAGIASGVSHGICSNGMSENSLLLYEAASFATLAHLCGKSAKVEKHCRITRDMIDESYELLLERQKDSYSYRDDTLHTWTLSKEQKQDSIRKEQQKWNEWIDYRNKIASELPADVRDDFNEGTNNAMRQKLLQNKNQYNGVGIYGGDVIRCMLPQDCTDDELLEYPSFGVVQDIYLEHLDDNQWENWKRYRVYVNEE